MEKKNHEILAALQYKLPYNISRSEKWVKKIQASAYNGVRTVVRFHAKVSLGIHNKVQI